MRMVTQWWKFFHPRLELVKALREMSRVCMRSQVSKYHAVAIVPANILPSHFVVVFLGDPEDVFPIIQSVFHDLWVSASESSLGGTGRYIIRDCFMTFPFPDPVADSLRIAGQQYERARATLLLAREFGLTKLYNQFHKEKEVSSEFVELRNLQQTMDQAVATAYGWSDLNFGHDFHETKQGVRFTISEPARREVLQRLLKLNHDRYAEEVKKGLHGKKGDAKKAVPKKKASRKMPREGTKLFDLGEDDA